MRSNNPVFRNSDTFNGRAAYAGPSGYTDPSTWSTGLDATGAPPAVEGRITIDAVVQKSAVVLGVMVLAAAGVWIGTGDLTASEDFGQLMGIALAASLIAFGLSLANSFKRVVSPALVVTWAVFAGAALGAFSKSLEAIYDGVVSGAIIGTVAAFAGTLAAYKMLNIKVGDRFRRGVIAAMWGFIAVTLLDVVLYMFGAEIGFNSFGTLGLIMSLVGVVLGVFMLILNFDYVENAIAAGAPERESWRAAFGLAVALYWIYIELLRILAILQQE